MLDLSSSQLTGEIPNWLWEINDGNLFSESFCNQFMHFQETYRFGILDFLDLHSNLLTRDISLPPIAAKYVDFSNNKFATLMPPDFGNYLGKEKGAKLNATTKPIWWSDRCKQVYVQQAEPTRDK